ncbi:MAG: phosphoribosyltransferase family protein [archaeon]
MYHNRKDAGLQLAHALRKYSKLDAIVLGIPLSGMEVAYHAAKALHLPLDATVVKNFLLGATGTDVHFVNPAIVRDYDLSDKDVERLILEKKKKAKELYAYFGGKKYDLSGKIAILIDDGLSTGMTANIACQIVRMGGAKRVVLALPVAYSEALKSIESRADEVVCLNRQKEEVDISKFYTKFPNVDIPKIKEYLSG